MKVLVPLAEGVEEMEAVIIIDTLRRAGWEVVGAGIQAGPVLASRGVRLLADGLYGDLDRSSFDMIVLPGGNGGTEALSKDERVLQDLREFHADQDRYVAAVCAGPLVLQAAGILDDQAVTCHPGARRALTCGNHRDEAVVVSDKLITSQGPGTSFAFALKLIELVDGAEAARRIADAMVL